MKFQAAAIIAATIAFAQPAVAQDAPPAYPEMKERVARDPLTGLRVEVLAGYDRLEGNYYEDDTKYYDGYSGVGIGGEVGYDVAVSSRVLLGAYAGIGKSTQKQCDEVLGGDELCEKAGVAKYAGVRVGFPIGDRALAYLRGGYSAATLEANYDVGGNAPTVSADEDYHGYHLGAGVEKGIAARAYLKADIAITSYSTKNTSYEGVNFERYQASVGIGFRF